MLSKPELYQDCNCAKTTLTRRDGLCELCGLRWFGWVRLGKLKENGLGYSSILLIEDDESIREITQELLESEGYGVSTAANGQAALETLSQMDPLPCLILLDLMMPVMDGWQFMEKKRLDPRLNAIPVVAFSALEERKINAAKTDDVIRKPINPEVMIKVIEKYCQPVQ